MFDSVKKSLRKRLQRAFRPLVQERLLPLDERIHQNPFIVGKLYPYDAGSTHYVVPLESPAAAQHNGLPIPPQKYWEGYAETEADYIAGGEKDMATLLRILGEAGESAQTLTKVYDLGCAAGRMLRHYPYTKGVSELWGSDINAKYINWCQQQFPEPFRFFTNTTAPHLPFADNGLDLVYCGSVFTHITDVADMWFLEIQRVLRTGGYAYLTIHDEHTVDVLFTRYKDDPLFTDFVQAVRRFYDAAQVGAQPYALFSIEADPVSQIFYNRSYLLQKWSRFAEVISVNPEAHDHQTAVLLRKR